MASPTEGTFIIILKGRVRGIATQKINYMGQRGPTGRDETVRKRAASCTPLQVNLEDAGGGGGGGRVKKCLSSTFTFIRSATIGFLAWMQNIIEIIVRVLL